MSQPIYRHVFSAALNGAAPIGAALTRAALIGTALMAALLAASAAHAAEADFIERFDGAWKGGGMVIRNETSGPTNIRCSLSGEGAENTISIAGKCRAFAIFTRDVRVNVVYEPASGLYRGTYKGSKVGTAVMSGKRSGDTIRFALVWPKDVMGDTEAAMTITNNGAGELRVLVSDKVGAGGTVQPVTDLALVNN
ncbi:hypothetical protein J2R99_000726 [Rhodopseudomonas julia]|uniref:Uncharacterized protein n=1 Tax=Rhodopseudomonas julia TaxID=200617 RepID=A0ABU0C716_9BRAD|nr:hypothetical protein [Rhodopseudomonas julia]MDQ0324877.1 hypothetical protein [Rhodopseudomonas julia]